METNTFLLIITVVSGIMNIILFFKIWGMTNDIDDFHKYICPDTSNLKVLIGENCYEAAYRRACAMADEAYNTLTDSPEDAAAKKQIDEVNLVMKFLGRELPPYLRSLDAYHEYKLYANKLYRKAHQK